MFNLANVIPSYDESLAPVPRFCLANNCGRVVFPEPFQHELGFCNVCISQMQPRYNPLSLANDRINGDPSQIPIFTPSGEFPHKFHHNTFREAGGSNHVPHAPSESIMHPPIRHMPSSFYIQPPQSISHLQTLDSDWMRSTYITYQRLSDRNVLSNTGYPATGLPHGFTPQDRQPTLQLHPLNCEKCHVFMSNHLVGDGRVCSSCLFQHRAREPSVSTKSSSPLLNLDSFEHRDVIDLTGDDGDGLGHALMIGTGSAVQTLSAPPNRIEIRSPSSQRESSSDLSPPPKRQRIDEGVQNAFTESYKNDDQLATPAEGNILKICSTPSCDQTIPVESCGSRCISCVKIDWKSIKHRFKPSRPHHEREARNILPSALAKSTKPKCRKSVTWSDMVAVASEDGSIIQCLARDIEEDRLSASSCDNEQGGDGVNTPIAAHILDTIGHEKMDVVRSTDICLELEPRVETQEIRLAPPDKSIASTTGWDSDLSEISESDDGSSSDDSPQSSVPTGLTIRIPAPSSIVCSRKCKNPLCNQGLAPNYSGKTCIMCRVRGRQIQQRRKGLRDGEDITMLDDKPPKLIPDARLCSASECTHFIPPQQEYKFKRCSLCRLYQDKRRLRRRKSNHQYESTKPLADVKEIYNSFRFLPVRFPAPGRCPSLDCGLLHERGSTLCRQCVSRRSKLMKKAGIQEENRGVNVKQDKPSPGLNIYPQYISHSFLVSDFEDRLKAFLQSQAVFFLFRMRSLVGTKALFSFDGEYSVVTVDSDVIGRKTEIDVRALKTKRDLEGIEGLRFTPKRLISVLDGGGVAIRFRCTYQASILRPRAGESSMAITEAMKPMTGELEIAVFPDHSHRCLPGEKTIIRFRLLG